MPACHADGTALQANTLLHFSGACVILNLTCVLDFARVMMCSWPAAGSFLCHLCGASHADAEGGALHRTHRCGILGCLVCHCRAMQCHKWHKGSSVMQAYWQHVAVRLYIGRQVAD
jgi:hypothetical protein